MEVRKKKRLLALTLSFAMLLTLLAACGSSGGSAGKPSDQPAAPTPPPPRTTGKTYTMRIGTLTVETEQNTATALDFAEKIEAATDGRVTVQVFPTGQLGTAAQMIEGMQTGLYRGRPVPHRLSDFRDPSVAFIGVPGFAGNDIDSLCAVMNELGGVDIVNDSLTQVGLHMVGLLYTDKYSYLLSDKRVNSLDDTKGMKLWTPPSDYTSAIISGMGATATFFDTSDLPSASSRVPSTALWPLPPCTPPRSCTRPTSTASAWWAAPALPPLSSASPS